MLCEDIHPIYLRTSDLWDAYSLEDHLLQKVKLHLIKTHWLSGEGKWDRVSGAEPLVFFSRLFDVVRFLLGSECTTRVEKMVCVGSLEPGSTRIAGCYPDAFLQMAPGTPPTPGKFRWRDLVCPFEYTLGDDTTDDDAKAPQTAAHIMRSDPRRAFSFGVRVYGTTFSIWLLCRAASFAFAPFDWNEHPESLLKFFILLATSSKEDLGIEANIETIGKTNLRHRFDIQGRKYDTLKLLYDIGARTAIGRGTRVFEAKDRTTKRVYIIKDCWIDDYPGVHLECDIITGIKNDMDDNIFRRYFIDICGHQKTVTSGALNNLWEILKSTTSVPRNRSDPHLPAPTTNLPKPIYVAGQRTRREQVPANTPHPRCRHQVVYEEKGTPLFDVTSFADVFAHIGRAADALYYLHQAGWVHGDFTPGNIIVVGTVAKLSDLELAQQRAVNQLERLTRKDGTSSHVVRDLPMGSWRFMAVEVKGGRYLFLPPVVAEDLGDLEIMDDLIQDDWTKGGDGEQVAGSPNDYYDAPRPPRRIFLRNHLHDYESVWWVAVWFVFCCKLGTEDDGVLERLRYEVYEDRSLMFVTGEIVEVCKLLPAALQPLGQVLVKMRNILVCAYRSFEESFDASGMLLIFQKLRVCLKALAERSRGLDVKPPVVMRRLEEVEWFDAVEFEGGQSQRAREGDSVLGKRVHDDSSPGVDRVLKPRVNGV